MKKYLQDSRRRSCCSPPRLHRFHGPEQGLRDHTRNPDTNLANLEALSQVAYPEFAVNCYHKPDEWCVKGFMHYFRDSDDHDDPAFKDGQNM